VSLRTWASCAALGAVIAIASCGIDPDHLYNASDGSGASGLASSTSSGEGASTGDGGFNNPVGSTSSSASASSGGLGGDVSNGSGGGSGGSVFVGAGGAAGVGGGIVTGPEIHCAGGTCAPGEVCCWNYQDADLDHCGSPNSCGQDYLTIECDGPEDCPGQVCCAEYELNGGSSVTYVTVECRPTCAEPQTVIMCNADDTVCVPPLDCEQSSVLGPGFDVCK
jgi:hypothetical protein